MRKLRLASAKLANGRWCATVEFKEAASAAHVVGKKLLLVGDKAVTSAPLGSAEAEAFEQVAPRKEPKEERASKKQKVE